MAVLKLTVGIHCGDDDPPPGVTIEELRRAIMQERETLEAIYCLLRNEDPKKVVSRALTSKIRALCPTLRWKR
jgi:hypothetical protein